MVKNIIKRCLFINLLLLHINSISQNLVQNPGFEDFLICPNENNSSTIFDFIPFWSNINSSGYLNRCSDDRFGIPLNMFFNSYQETYSGNGYAGFDNLNWYFGNQRGYLSNELNTLGLSNGKCFYVEFYVSLVNYLRYGTNNIAMHFSLNNEIPYKLDFNQVLDAKPHIKKFGNPIISDTMNWVKISGIYQAKVVRNTLP
jgi:hypothetical protein